MLTNNSGLYCITDLCLVLIFHGGFGGFGSSCSTHFYDLQPLAWLFDSSISFLETLEPSLVLIVMFNCDRLQFLLLRYENCIFW